MYGRCDSDDAGTGLAAILEFDCLVRSQPWYESHAQERQLYFCIRLVLTPTIERDSQLALDLCCVLTSSSSRALVSSP